jgi:hypothetical protein
MDWNAMQGWGALGGLTVIVVGLVFASGKMVQDHVHTKDKIKTLEDDINTLKSKETAVELVKQAVEGLKEQFIELRHDLREFISIELGKKVRSDNDER